MSQTCCCGPSLKLPGNPGRATLHAGGAGGDSHPDWGWAGEGQPPHGACQVLQKHTARRVFRSAEQIAGCRARGCFKEINRSSRLQKRKQAQTTAPGSSSLLRLDGGMCGSPQCFLKGRGGRRFKHPRRPTAGLRSTHPSRAPLGIPGCYLPLVSTGLASLIPAGGSTHGPAFST